MPYGMQTSVFGALWRLATLSAILLPILTTPTVAIERRICFIDLAIFGTGFALLCDGPASPASTDTACSAFTPWHYSSRDTIETIRQAREHNAAWDALCKEPRK